MTQITKVFGNEVIFRIEHIVKEYNGEEYHEYYPQYYMANDTPHGQWNFIEFSERSKTLGGLFGPVRLLYFNKLQKAYDFINFLTQQITCESIRESVPVVEEDKENWQQWCKETKRYAA